MTLLRVPVRSFTGEPGRSYRRGQSVSWSPGAPLSQNNGLAVLGFSSPLVVPAFTAAFGDPVYLGGLTSFNILINATLTTTYNLGFRYLDPDTFTPITTETFNPAPGLGPGASWIHFGTAGPTNVETDLQYHFVTQFAIGALDSDVTVNSIALFSTARA